MKIIGSARAVRVLEALVEQIEKQRNDNTPRGRLNRPLPTELGWAEGAKAALEQWEQAPKYGDEFDPETSYLRAVENVLVSLAQAYAPRMLEAGMTVPE